MITIYTDISPSTITCLYAFKYYCWLYSLVGRLNNMSMADSAHDEEATQVPSGSHDPLHEQIPEEDVIEQFSVQEILPSQKPKQLHNRKFRE